MPKSGRATTKAAAQKKPDITAVTGTGLRNQATMHTSLEPTSRMETKNASQSQNCSEQVSLMNTEKQPNKPSTSEIPPALRNQQHRADPVAEFHIETDVTEKTDPVP